MILMNDFKNEPIELKNEMTEAIRNVIDSGWYILGLEGKRFEQRWANLCGVQRGVGVGNGMDAIEIAIRVLGIGEGDEISTTSMTALATVLAIVRAGATPVIADVDPTTGLMCFESVERCVSNKTRALILVHLYGQLSEIDRWVALCNSYGIELIEDCAQAHLSSLNNKCAGSFGRVSAFSFYPTKNLGALGDAGMMLTSTDEFANRAEIIRNYGQNNRYEHSEIGLNSRLDEIQAAVLNVRLNWLKEYTERRQDIACAYLDGIKHNEIKHLARPIERTAHVYHLFVIRCTLRDILVSYLNNNAIQSLIHYPIPIHLQSPFINIKRDPQGLVGSEVHANQCISLPCHPQMTDEQVYYVIETVNRFKF